MLNKKKVDMPFLSAYDYSYKSANFADEVRIHIRTAYDLQELILDVTKSMQFEIGSSANLTNVLVTHTSKQERGTLQLQFTPSSLVGRVNIEMRGLKRDNIQMGTDFMLKDRLATPNDVADTLNIKLINSTLSKFTYTAPSLWCKKNIHLYAEDSFNNESKIGVFSYKHLGATARGVQSLVLDVPVEKFDISGYSSKAMDKYSIVFRAGVKSLTVPRVSSIDMSSFNIFVRLVYLLMPEEVSEIQKKAKSLWEDKQQVAILHLADKNSALASIAKARVMNYFDNFPVVYMPAKDRRNIFKSLSEILPGEDYVYIYQYLYPKIQPIMQEGGIKDGQYLLYSVK